MSENRIDVVYTGIGYGKPLYGRSAAEWLNMKSGYEVGLHDLLQLPGVDKIRATILMKGYQTLSYAPPAIYKIARRSLDRGNNKPMVDPESLKAMFNGSVIVSVSPVVCHDLALAGLPHYGVVGDMKAQPDYFNNQIIRLFTPYEIKHKETTIENVGGVLLPTSFQNVNHQDKMLRLKEGYAKIGFITHGAGDIQTILSLLGVRKGLKEKRLHAAFFVGDKYWMATMLQSMAKTMEIEVVDNIDDGVGSISIWKGSSLNKILDIKSKILPQLDLFISPTANETSLTGPCLVRGARNDVELANIKVGLAKGWLKVCNFPAHRVWTELEPLLLKQHDALNMYRAFIENMNLTAGDRIVQGVMQDLS